jgi:type VI secretion system protein ImpE
LAQLQEQVRAKPADPKLRIFLFQLLCVLGQWERALNQLSVASNLDPSALAMAQMYGDAVRCEVVRDGVFEGKKSPMIFGQPDEWLALLIESAPRRPGRARALCRSCARASKKAPATAGDIDKRPFAWIADADSRRSGAQKRSSTAAITGAVPGCSRSTSRSPRRPATWSGCRRTCSSRTAASRSR